MTIDKILEVLKTDGTKPEVTISCYSGNGRTEEAAYDMMRTIVEGLDTTMFQVRPITKEGVRWFRLEHEPNRLTVNVFYDKGDK